MLNLKSLNNMTANNQHSIIESKSKTAQKDRVEIRKQFQKIIAQILSVKGGKTLDKPNQNDGWGITEYKKHAKLLTPMI